MEATKEYREDKIKDSKKVQIYLYFYLYKSVVKQHFISFIYFNI